MQVSIDGAEPIHIDEFLQANDLDPIEQAELLAALREVGTYRGGGGAAAEFTLCRIDPPPAFYTVAIYLVDRAYGGPEEGGWYYDCGTRVDHAVDGINPNDLLTVFKGEGAEDEARSYCETLNLQLAATVNKGRRPISSVLSDGQYEARVCAGYPEHFFPAVIPHYE